MDYQDTICALEKIIVDQSGQPMRLTMPFLEKLTDNFSPDREIGRGGCAVVYQVELEYCYAAVKRLLKVHTVEDEFREEIQCLMMAKHRNVVQFLGYCSDTQGNMTSYKKKMVMSNIPQRILVFEYLPHGLEHYITDPTCGLEWQDRFDILKGICAGLHHLHQINILHLDLKPANIMLDFHMNPKITDFGISRRLEENQTRVIAAKAKGTGKYMAPELVEDLQITKQCDLYSLGVIITEILTGTKQCVSVDTVLKSWSDRCSTAQTKEECEQIRVCAQIAIECTQSDPADRPVDVKNIIERLAETESFKYYNELHPLKHRFYRELSESIPFSLHLTNKTDEHVVFRLFQSADNPVYGTVPFRSTCIFIWRSKEFSKTDIEIGIDLVLQSTTLGEINATTVIIDNKYACEEVFEEAERFGHGVYELLIYDGPERKISTTKISTTKPVVVQQVNKPHPQFPICLDTHPTEPWILTGHSDGALRMWNPESETTIGPFKISEGKVRSVKFHATKTWLLAMTSDHFIHVYDCACVTQIQKITSFKYTDSSCHSVAFHPTKPYVLSVPSRQLWDGEKGWECTHTFGSAEQGISAVEFNQHDHDTFACAMHNNTIEVWSIDSSEPHYTLTGHSDSVRCLAFFKSGDRQCLITGSADCTAKIWDLQTRACIYTLGDFDSSVDQVSFVPGPSYLVTCFEEGESSFHVWSSIDFRLKTTITISSGIYIDGLACFMDSRRIAILNGEDETIYLLDLDDEEETSASEENTEDYKCAPGESSNQ